MAGTIWLKTVRHFWLPYYFAAFHILRISSSNNPLYSSSGFLRPYPFLIEAPHFSAAFQVREPQRINMDRFEVEVPSAADSVTQV
ncbi:MAG: hypothetical protein HON04_20025 [Planctomicrobium sp.]|nr:hypothetical protein [Planctomicrobium sp.]